MLSKPTESCDFRSRLQRNLLAIIIIITSDNFVVISIVMRIRKPILNLLRQTSLTILARYLTSMETRTASAHNCGSEH